MDSNVEPLAPEALEAIEAEEERQKQGLLAALMLNAAMVRVSTGAFIAEPLASRMYGVESAVLKLNKRAPKLGVEPMRLVTLGEVLYPRRDEHTGLPIRPIVRTVVAVFGEAPKAAGYSLLARIEHTEAGCLLAHSPIAYGVDLSRYYDARPVCEHCGFNRKRKDTFVIREDATGTLSQIGRNCLADFVRSADIERALQFWQFLHEITRACGDVDEDFVSGGWCSSFDDTTQFFVACAVASIRASGFRKTSNDHSTLGDVNFLRGPCPRGFEAEKLWDEGQPTRADSERAQLVLAWARACDEGSGDYLRNLRIAASLPTVGRHGGLLASAPVAYQRHVERAWQDQWARRVKPAGRHVGEVGQRVELGNLTVVRVRFYENDWGTKTIVTAHTTDGATITWFATGSRDFDAGTVLEGAKGTVRRSTTLIRGTPQTVVSRLAWKNVVKPTESKHAEAKSA